MSLDKGMKARVRPSIIEGEIARKKFDEDTGAKLLLLSWKDGDDEPHERWFTEEELEAVDAPAEDQPVDEAATKRQR